jgi:hypothetical protein
VKEHLREIRLQSKPETNSQSVLRIGGPISFAELYTRPCRLRGAGHQEPTTALRLRIRGIALALIRYVPEDSGAADVGKTLVYRLYREEGLTLRYKPRRRRLRDQSARSSTRRFLRQRACSFQRVRRTPVVSGRVWVIAAVRPVLRPATARASRGNRSMGYGACNPTMRTCHPSDGEIENWLS